MEKSKKKKWHKKRGRVFILSLLLYFNN